MHLPPLRPYWVVFHRWTGLVLAIVLVLLGLTGSLLAFYEPLDRVVAPQLLVASPPTPAAIPIDPFELRAELLDRHPELRVDYLSLHQPQGQAVRFHVAPQPAKPGTEAFDEVFVDPYTGRELGSRLWGDITQGSVNLMTFIYRLHYSLAMGEAGILVLGILALLWTVDCFVGAYLTFPPRLPRRVERLAPNRKSWWSRWRSAWVVRWSATSYKFNFDMHRAGALWLWAMLFVFAWSGVAFNLQAVYKPVMGMMLPYADVRDKLAPKPVPLAGELSTAQWREAFQQGQRLLNELAAEEGFEVHRIEGLSISRETHTWRLDAMTSRDIREKHGATQLYFDVETGRLLASALPSGRSAGNTVTSWLLALHMAQVGGLAFRIFVCIAGIAVVSLSITGLVIWWCKRRARRVLETARRSPALTA